jgi:hypothetical protein
MHLIPSYKKASNLTCHVVPTPVHSPIDTVNTLDWFVQAGDNLIDVNPRYEKFECRGDLDVCVNPWEDDDYDDPDALLATPLVPAVPVAKRKGEA